MKLQEFVDHIRTLLEDTSDSGIDDITDFRDAGLLTRNRGLVITMEDGSEFQCSMVQSIGVAADDED